MAEAQLHRALQMTLGDQMVFFESPGSATLLSLAVIALLAPFAMKGLSRFRAAED
jgi:putative tricarboxylic transport membrane protein